MAHGGPCLFLQCVECLLCWSACVCVRASIGVSGLYVSVDFLEIMAYFLVYLNRAHTRGGTPMLTGSVFGSVTRGQIFGKLLTCQQPTDGGESQQMRLCVSTGKTWWKLLSPKVGEQHLPFLFIFIFLKTAHFSRLDGNFSLIPTLVTVNMLLSQQMVSVWLLYIHVKASTARRKRELVTDWPFAHHTNQHTALEGSTWYVHKWE